MAGPVNASAFGAGCMQPAASASSCSQAQMPMKPSGDIVGPSTTGCYVRPMQFNQLPQQFNTTPTEGQYGYGYYNPSNANCYRGTFDEYHNPNNAQGMGGASHANAGACGNLCFSALATTPVNSCGFDQGGVPLTIGALDKYDNPALVAANTLSAWQGLMRNCACAGQIAQWGSLEGGTRGLCLLGPAQQHGGLCIQNQGGGGSNNGWGYISYPQGCIVTFMHELQEVYNYTCSQPVRPGVCAPQDNSDVRACHGGCAGADHNNFKSCGVGYSCFDTAFTQYWGTNYGFAPCAWQEAKTPAYQGGALLGPGGGPVGPVGPGGPGTPGPGGPITILPGCVTLHNYTIPQAAPAKSCSCVTPGRKRMPKPQDTPNSPYPYAHGGYTCVNPYRMASGGNTSKRLDCSAHAAPAVPAPAPQPIKAPPICITIPAPGAPAPAGPRNIVPFVSASPAYPYRGTVCANQITYPGGETWNFPLGSPEVPGGPGIPTPPGCGPKPPPSGPGAGNPVVPITNNPGICGIQCINGTWTLIGPCGPLTNPVCTGTPAPQPCGPGPQPCNPCNPCGPCNPQPQPCNPCGPKPCGPQPCVPPPSPFGTVSPFMPCYMGQSPWPSPQNVFGGALPQTPWLPGGKVDNGLGPSPSMPASPVYGPAPADNANYQSPNIPAPVMPFGAPSSTTTTTTTGVPCTNGFPTFCQWNQRENCQMMAHNCTPGAGCVWGLASNLQAGNIAFPTHTTVCTSTSPGVAPVTPGQCGNAAAYPGSDKWTGTNPNPYITQNAPSPAPCGPGCGPGCGDGDCDWDDQGGQSQALSQQHAMWGGQNQGSGGQPGTCYFTQYGSAGPTCFGGSQFPGTTANGGVWGGWGNPYGQTGDQVEDPAEGFIGNNWCSWIQNDANKQGHGTPSTVTTQGAIPCWNPPNWNNGNNPAFGNTSSPVAPGAFPTWPGQGPATGSPSVGGYTSQATPFLNGDLYHPGFETVGACFQGNPWQPTCLSQVNPGAISMGLAGMQIPAPTPAPTPGTSGSPGTHHAHGGHIGNLVDVELSPGENVHMPCGAMTTVPGQAEYGGDTTKNDTYRTKLPPGAIVVPRTAARDPEKEARFVAAIRAQKSPSQALRRANG